VEKKDIKNRELFSAVTHEIKNSLNPVINLSGILRRSTVDRLTADENSYLEVIERNGKKILNLVDALSFSVKLAGKKGIIEDSTVSVKEAIENAFTSMMTLSSNAGYKLVFDLDDNSSFLNTKRDIFRRILESICLFFISSAGDSNDICFTGSRPGRDFQLIASRKKAVYALTEKNYFDKEKFIEKGFSASTVMWLQLASLYIESINGKAYFGDEGGDAVFMFSIPVNPVESPAEVAGKDKTENEPAYSGREFVMLVIDDDIDNITPINAIIEIEFKGAVKVYHAESGEKSLDLLEKIRPDIILLDLTLPDISGLSLVKNIKHLFVKNNIPVIAFTALDIAWDKDRMIRSGFDDVIKKPFNIDTFVRIISKWIN